jgi:endonuclease YncB( thermonuclease family)
MVPTFRRLAVSLVLLLASAGLHAETLTGKVIRIADGDTVTILDRDHRQFRIRVAGIDAPERKQPYYEVSKQNLARLAFGRTVTVDWRKHDRYGRIVGNIRVAGEDVGLAQVRAGLAWWYRDYARDQTPEDRKLYEAAELGARHSRAGLWQEANPVEPKRVRHPEKVSQR